MKSTLVVYKVLFTIFLTCRNASAISVALTLKNTQTAVTNVQRLIVQDRMKELSTMNQSSSAGGIDVIALLNNANTAYTGSLLFGTPLQGSTFSS